VRLTGAWGSLAGACPLCNTVSRPSTTLRDEIGGACNVVMAGLATCRQHEVGQHVMRRPGLLW
jgi:hypothetical protein